MTASAPTISPAVERRRSRWRLEPSAAVAIVFLVLLVAAAAYPALFTSADPAAVDPRSALQPPSLDHFFGTDQSGRDVYTRIVYGARDSLIIGILATAISLLIGAVLGLLAGLGGKVVDAIVSRFIEILFSFPSLLLALLVLTLYGTNVVVTTIAIGIALSPGLARLVRAESLVVRRSGYVETARVLGHSPARVLFSTITPNVLRPLLAFAFLNVGSALIWSMTLGFFGFGARPPAPEWGAMLADSQDYILQVWWLPLFAGLAVILTAASATIVGRYLQRVMSGREKAA